MADIYRRAQRVLVWLGTVEGPESPKIKPPPKRSSFRISRRDERKLETKSPEEKLREAEEQEVAEYNSLSEAILD